ncbi:MAG TPA: PQQ-binding-like beta-propeller repeat protein, partial [Baekduia sp.]|nr:PQQ-binding-like beta-propeller repeat protein [Baekduia sp.]
MMKGLLLAAVAALGSAGSASAATLELSSVKGPPTAAFDATAGGYAPGEAVVFHFAPTGDVSVPAGPGGSATATLTVPAGTLPGKYTVSVDGGASAVYLVRTNWAQARFSEKRGGTNVFENILNPANVGSLAPLFDRPCGDGGDGETPTVASGRAYVASRDGTLCAVNKASGKAYWSTDVRGLVVAPIAAAYTKLYVTAGHRLLALDSKSGAVEWAGRTEGGVLQSSPAVYKGTVYVGSRDGYLYAYDAAGCEGEPLCYPLWRGRVKDAVLSAPSAYGHYVVVTSADGSVRKFDADGCGKSVCDALAVADGTGSRHDLRTSVALTGSPETLVWATFGDGRVAALSARDLHTVRSISIPGRPRLSSPAVTGDAVYVTAGDGTLRALSRATLAPLWTATLPAGATPPGQANGPAVANGVVYVGTGDGGTAAYAASGCGAAVLDCPPLWYAPAHGGASAVVS